MNTEHCAWWATELGTLPRTAPYTRHALVAHHDDVGVLLLGHPDDGLRRVPRLGVPLHGNPGGLGPGAQVLEQRVGLAAGTEVLTELLGHVRDAHRFGLVHRHHVQCGAEELGQLHGAAHGLAGRRRTICADHHRREHAHPSDGAVTLRDLSPCDVTTPWDGPAPCEGTVASSAPRPPGGPAGAWEEPERGRRSPWTAWRGTAWRVTAWRAPRPVPRTWPCWVRARWVRPWRAGSTHRVAPCTCGTGRPSAPRRSASGPSTPRRRQPPPPPPAWSWPA